MPLSEAQKLRLEHHYSKEIFVNGKGGKQDNTYDQYCIDFNSNVPASFVDNLHKVVETITSKSLDVRMQFDTQKAWSLFSDKVENFLDELNLNFNQKG